MWKSIGSIFLLLLILIIFSGCASAYLAGPLGYEDVPIPPPENRDVKPVEQNIYISASGTVMSGFPVAPRDYSFFGEVSLSQSWLFSSDNSGFLLPWAASGWIGSVHLEKGQSYSSGLLPGDFYYTGGSFQIEPGLLIQSIDNEQMILGVFGILSYETGTYSDFRKQIVGESSSSYAFINGSDTPWNLTVGPYYSYWGHMNGFEARYGNIIRVYYIIPSLGSDMGGAIFGLSYTAMIQMQAIGFYVRVAYIPIFNFGLSTGITLQVF